MTQTTAQTATATMDAPKSKVDQETTKQSPQGQLDELWESLVDHNSAQGTAEGQRSWPTYEQVMSNIANSDYTETLTCPHDRRFVSSGLSSRKTYEKALCPYGLVCRAKVELFADGGDAPYSGLLQPGQTHEHCLLRLSSAIKPALVKSRIARTLLRGAVGEKIATAKLFPTAALKIFRQDIHSGNVLFGGSKVGQRQEDYFAHCQCTQMTEQMPRTMRPFVNKFYQYSENPLALGLSDFCNYNADGVSVADLNFPFLLVLKPAHTLTGQQDDGDESSSFDCFLDDVLNIPNGTHLFDLFACPDPKSVPRPENLQRIGRIVSTSDMMASLPNDGLFFRHQKKEEDFLFNPEWKEEAQSTQCSIDGKNVGSVNKLAGWKLFEAHIAKGVYQDYEKR